MVKFLAKKSIRLLNNPPKLGPIRLKNWKGNVYKYGFSTSIQTDEVERGIDIQTIEMISKKKNEPQFFLDFRKRAFKKWTALNSPSWGELNYAPINYDEISCYSSPKQKPVSSLEEVDPELLQTFEKLGIPLNEQKQLSNVAVDAIFDSFYNV